MARVDGPQIKLLTLPEQNGTPPAPPEKAATNKNLASLAHFFRLRAFGTEQQASDFIADERRKRGVGETAEIQTMTALQTLFARPPRAETVELAPYLERICSAMERLVSSQGATKLICECDKSCEVHSDDAPLIGLIVGEMILNAARHAHPTGVTGRIDVGCERNEGHLIVEVVDDGIGLPDDFFAVKGGSLGLEMVRILAKRLNATPIFESDALGLQFLLRLTN